MRSRSLLSRLVRLLPAGRSGRCSDPAWPACAVARAALPRCQPARVRNVASAARAQQDEGEIFVREGFYLQNLGNDNPYNVSEPGLFDKPAKLDRPDTTPEVTLRLPDTCSLEKTETCRPDLDLCLLDRPTRQHADAICECYLEHGRCFWAAGCREALPTAVTDFCFNTMRCRRTQCDGSGASTAQVGLAALLVAAMAIVAAQFGRPPAHG